MNNNFTEFNTGGSHESNQLGGIPLGINPQTGAPITVEEGETKTKVGGLDYIFSNNFKVSKKIIKDFSLPPNMEGLSMSDASKKIAEMFSDRNDGISKNTMSQFLSRLSDAQEQLKAEKVQQLQETIALNNQYPDETLEGQMPPEAQQFQEKPQMGQPMQQPTPDGLGAIGQQQMDDGGYQKQGWFGTTPGAGTQANSGVAAGNAVGAATGIMGLVDQASGNTSPDTGKSALMGAASGAAVGTMIFPGIGTAIGAGVGAIAGYAGAKGAQKKIIKQTNNAAMNYNAQFQEQYNDGGFPGLGNTMLQNNIYGGFKPQVKQNNNPLLQQQYELGQNIMTPDYLNKVAPHYANQNPIKNAQSFLTNQGYVLKGGVDGDFGNSSKAALAQWRKKNGLNIQGDLSSADYEAMGYTNMGYIPYEETLDEIVIDKTEPAQYTDPRVVPTQYQTTPTDPKDPTKKNNFDYNNMLRYMTPLGNALQLGSLREPQMGNMHQDLTKARRDYIDENTMARTIRNQGNTLNRSIQASGMTEGARRASMLASGLNTQEALGNAFIQAQQANRQVDQVADQLDAQTRQSNQRNRMLADENYQRDMGAYNTEKLRLQGQSFENLGNIGLEGVRADRLGKAFEYSVDGKYITDGATGEKWDSAKIEKTKKEYQTKAASAKTDKERKSAEKRLKDLERYDQLLKAEQLKEEQKKSTNKNN